MVLLCSMSRWIFAISAVLLASRAFVRADGPPQSDDDDDCLIYEDEVDFLDGIQPAKYVDATKSNADGGISQNKVVGALQPRDPSPYAAFELLDGLTGSTDSPIELLDSLRPMGRLEVEHLDSLPEPTKSTSAPSLPPLGMPGKYDGFELLDTLPQPTESTIDRLDELPTVGYSKVATKPSTPAPVKPHKYQGFELLDSIPPEVQREAPTTTAAPKPVYVRPTSPPPAPTRSTTVRPATSRLPIVPPVTPARPTYRPPVVLPVRDDLKVVDRKPTVLPAEPAPRPRTNVFDHFNDAKLYRGIYEGTDEIITPDPSTYTTKNIRPPPITTPRPLPVRKPTSPPPMFAVRDHLEVPRQKPVILPAEFVPNHQDVIEDQFDEIKRYGGIYDVAPVLPSTQRPAPTTKFVPRPAPTSSRPPPPSRPVLDVKKVRFEPQPVRDHLEVRDFSPIIMPAEPVPDHEAPIFDQFEDIKRYGGIYDVAPEMPKPRAETYEEDGVEYSSDIQLYPNEKDVVSDQFGEIRGYGSTAKSSYGGPVDEYLFRPLAPVLDEFVTNDLGYGRSKRAVPSVAASSTQSKPKRKCLKRRPKKISHQMKKTETPKTTEPSAEAIQSGREASARCLGHRHGDLVQIGSCKKFYIRCDQEHKQDHKLMMCTRRGEVYSHSLYGCVPKTEAPECPSYVVTRPISATVQLARNGTLESFCVQRSDGIYRHFADCARVIQCFDGDAFEYPPCPKKLVFDEKHGTCEYKRNVLGC